MSSRAAALRDIDFIELWVEDADAIAALYQRTFGFEPVAQTDPRNDSGLSSVTLAQGSANLLITSSTDQSSAIAQFVRRHGDGVRDIAFTVDDAAAAFDSALARGARAIHEPARSGDGGARMTRATIGGCGDLVHTFVQRDRPPPATSVQTPRAFSSCAIDHVSMCLCAGTLDDVAEYYKEALGFTDGHRERIHTQRSGMNSRVVEHGPIKLPLQEPINDAGQIAEFIELNNGPGVQHVALLTDDIVSTLRRLRSNEVTALPTVSAYYDMLSERVGAIDERLDDLRDLNVLVDRDEWGYLLQVFTRSLHSRRTLFFEVIQRKQARGFGSGNIRALFDAKEREQLGRGQAASHD